jgi:hypothetical protein
VLGPKTILHSRNHTRWGGFRLFPPFFLAVRSLGRQVFLISSASFPRYEIPYGCKLVIVEHTGEGGQADRGGRLACGPPSLVAAH